MPFQSLCAFLDNVETSLFLDKLHNACRSFAQNSWAFLYLS